MEDASPQEIMMVSSWAFVLWWFVFLVLHILTFGYYAAFAYIYFNLRDTMLNGSLEFFGIGMPSTYHPTIAIVHATMAILHGLNVGLMLAGSFWWGTLTFTPWGGPSINAQPQQSAIDNADGRTASRLASITNLFTDRYGLLGINGKHFHTLTTCREIVETILQSVQGYRMSWFLPSILLNRFFVVTLALNCWSSAIIYALRFRNNEARRRFALIACDCALDLISCMGVTLIVVLRYVGQYDTSIAGFDRVKWYNDEWTARALNEFQMVLVVSWADLVSRAIFSLGLLMTTTSLKEFLYRRTNQIGPSVTVISQEVTVTKCTQVMPSDRPTLPGSKRNSVFTLRLQRGVNRVVHALFLAWGCLVLALHIQASRQPTLPQCLLQVRPWAAPGTSCYLVGLDCHRLNISGERGEVDSLWRAFDGSSVVMMLIRHCPSLDVPDVFTEFHQLHGVKVYNSTIVHWRESAAMTNTNHPLLAGVLLIRVNMSDGLLPAGLQSSDSPRFLYDFELCATNLRELPDDLHTKWNPGSQILIEYSQLLSVPTTLLHLAAGSLSLTGNPISDLPAELFELEGVTHLIVGGTKIRHLPHNVTKLSSTLVSVAVPDTAVSYFWSWTDQLLERTSAIPYPPPILASGSAYCEDWKRILDGNATSFSVSEGDDAYSTQLMDPANAVSGRLLSFVDCSPLFRGPVYPLAIEDLNNAITS
ncbi:hypothetical protein PR003_g2004 [Phytophthora rubi]|uniref:Uncharacterized protein n=1 Tax=Phytophthora rubi TaxID=129364 RepID=A0A6A4G154_9STRA|nr:hypothetical protein PR003_g2004 [Phytophthora rubi]